MTRAQPAPISQSPPESGSVFGYEVLSGDFEGDGRTTFPAIQKETPPRPGSCSSAARAITFRHEDRALPMRRGSPYGPRHPSCPRPGPTNIMSGLLCSSWVTGACSEHCNHSGLSPRPLGSSEPEQRPRPAFAGPRAPSRTPTWAHPKLLSRSLLCPGILRISVSPLNPF